MSNGIIPKIKRLAGEYDRVIREMRTLANDAEFIRRRSGLPPLTPQEKIALTGTISPEAERALKSIKKVSRALGWPK